MKPQRLTVEDWIKAGFRCLTVRGIGAVKAEPLARALGVSKGSFYHHFKDIADLHQQMLDHWLANATQAIIEEVEGTGADPSARLTAVIALAASDRDAPYGGPTTEAAIRDWARTDPRAAKAQTLCDKDRLAYLEELFAGVGTGARAAQAARLFFIAFVGAGQLGPEGRRTAEADLMELARRLAPEFRG